MRNGKTGVRGWMLMLAAAGLAVAGGGATAQDAAPRALAVDTLTLTDGRTLTAPILKETDGSVWLDLGFDVVEIPRKEIRTILRADRTAAVVATEDEEAFYFTAEAGSLTRSTPAALAKQIGEAVVKVSTPSGLGSGYVLHPDGYVVTNAHVIQGETELTVTVFEEGEREFRRRNYDDVEILAVNNHLDLALLKVNREEGDDRPFPYVFIEGREAMEVGEEVFAIGNPLGLDRTLSTGVVATTQRNFEGLTFVQTTAEINPGNSGGPLFNLRGEVIGTINMGALAADGIGFAIPSRYVRDFLRNHEAFAYDDENPNSGYNYPDAPDRRRFGVAPELEDGTGAGG